MYEYERTYLEAFYQLALERAFSISNTTNIPSLQLRKYPVQLLPIAASHNLLAAIV